MLERLLSFMQTEGLWNADRCYLLAISGGVDSMVLLSLFQKTGLPFGVAHCNFQLRPGAADEDARFVRIAAEACGVRYHEERFETQQFAKMNKISTQMAARTLRYDWLRQTAELFDYQYIVTAHHLNDSIETVLLNLAKGCGMAGLHGILPQRNDLIRPLLFAFKSEILEFATQENIAFRQDASNQTDDYLRNFVRHQIVPLFRQINPNFDTTFQNNIRHFQSAELFYRVAIEAAKERVIIFEKDTQHIDIQKLMDEPAPENLLFEILHPFEFAPELIPQILNARHQSGKFFTSKNHRLSIERNFMTLCPIPTPTVDDFFLISKPNQTLKIQPNTLIISTLETEVPSIEVYHNSPSSIVWIDAQALNFPLKVRKWKQGDVFQPLGMKGKHKKLSDFFVAQKFSMIEKEKVWVIESGGKIVWVVGFRLDERFKITAQTKQTLRLEIRSTSD